MTKTTLFFNVSLEFSEEELLEKVREVSEDYIYDTLEFNEFLQLMAKQQDIVYTRTDLKSAFK